MKWLLTLIFVVLGFMVQAQPVLPNIMCVQEGNTVRLSWVCQYEGVKTVVVKRSYDSLRNYNQIGTVGEVGKGAEAFTDEHPLQGKSFYKLSVVFRSGLNWSSNHCGVVYDGSGVADTMKEKVESGALMPRARFKQVIPEVDLDASYIEPLYVRLNKTTGHVDVRLPSDVAGHVWSLVFYNSKKQVVMDVPVVRARNIVIDKRNFRKGQYKFVLRRDEVMVEWGYVSVQ